MERIDLASSWRSFVGPLSPVRSAAVLASAATGGVAVTVQTIRRSGGWRGVVTGGMAVDLVGGFVTFQLDPTRERYAGEALTSRLGFVLGHVQPFVLPLIGQGSWRRAAGRYATAVAATGLLEAAPLAPPARRLAATVLGAAASAVDLATGPSQQRWFGPAFFMKFVAGHAGIARETSRSRISRFVAPAAQPSTSVQT